MRLGYGKPSGMGLRSGLLPLIPQAHGAKHATILPNSISSNGRYVSTITGVSLSAKVDGAQRVKGNPQLQMLSWSSRVLMRRMDSQTPGADIFMLFSRSGELNNVLRIFLCKVAHHPAEGWQIATSRARWERCPSDAVRWERFCHAALWIPNFQAGAKQAIQSSIAVRHTPRFRPHAFRRLISVPHPP